MKKKKKKYRVLSQRYYIRRTSGKLPADSSTQLFLNLYPKMKRVYVWIRSVAGNPIKVLAYKKGAGFVNFCTRQPIPEERMLGFTEELVK